MAEPEFFPAIIENPAARGRLVLVCEHASNHIPSRWGDLGLSPSQRRAHIAWDPGALGVAQRLAAELDAVLVHAPVSRLVQDCNRSPDQAGAVAARSEDQEIPGNRGLSRRARAARNAAVYVPFHATLFGLLAQRIALGLAPVLVSVHSFTPVWFGTPRAVEFGIIHDLDDHLAQALLAEAVQSGALKAALNAPYSAADDVTHLLRLHALPLGLPNVMLEIRNDLIATAADEQRMAAMLAPMLATAIAQMHHETRRGAAS